MGQYYKIVFIDDKLVHEPRGLKLMEHSWIDNKDVNKIMSFIYENPKRIVWAGDYAEKEQDLDKNLYFLSENYQNILSQDIKVRYIYNKDKKEYIDLNDYDNIEEGWIIHPLPFLLAEGNGQGGGDYYGTEEEYIGKWSRNEIFTSNILINNYSKINPKFYEE